ncbi:MAG: acetate/propionate family kinase [Bryobacterales bacterium]|nr:acetate/propionate family kinase [Bryobacterales bacterium]
MRVLIPNLGSTSLKYRLLRFPGEQQLAAGRMERIGRPGGDAASYSDAIGSVLREVGEIQAVGFKAVHAGPFYRGTFRIDDGLLAALEEYAPAAPLHNGIYLEGIREFRALCPGLPLVAVMETGFHSTVPDHASTYGIPAEWRRRHGIRRYGFHGASHRSIGRRVPALLGAEESGLRTISCHLGGSSSICAIRNGRSCDVSMGFSPQTGLENATRHGELDPFAVLFLMDRLGMSAAAMRDTLVRDGGLAGLSGIAGGDVRDIEAAAREGSEAAELALAVFAYQAKKTIGAFAAAMGGADALAFTGGIGENSASLRQRICDGLQFLGIELDPERNAAAVPDCSIGRRGSRVACLVLAAQEELVVGREVYRLLGGGPPSG